MALFKRLGPYIIGMSERFPSVIYLPSFALLCRRYYMEYELSSLQKIRGPKINRGHDKMMEDVPRLCSEVCSDCSEVAQKGQSVSLRVE